MLEFGLLAARQASSEGKEADANYHPTARELELRGDNCSVLVANLEANRASRIAAAQVKEISAAALKEAMLTGYISLADSKAAGNCLGGSAIWAKSRGIDHTWHIPIRIVSRAADRGDGRAQAAIRVAVSRHSREMASGVCQLADHIV